MSHITGVTLRDDTIQRLGGQGDNWYATWASDDSLFVALCDGTGFPGLPRKNYNTRLYRVDGAPDTTVTFHEVPGYPDLSTPVLGARTLRTRYYGFGTIAIGNAIYQYLNTWNVPRTEGNMPTGGLRFVGAKLIYSRDGGATWHNQDGSTPVHWEDWGEQSKDNMVFFHEPNEAFSLQGTLQMGKGYELNRDGYVYVYSPNGNAEGMMNQLVMFRVPKNELLDRSSYEYFTRLNRNGTAEWSPDIADRGIVHTFPSGWVNTGVHPYAWQPYVVYNPGLDCYLMASWATGPDENGLWFGKPSYLGLYQARHPWGPWEQFHEDTRWTPAGDERARCYQPVIVPKWIARDGRSFWMVWTDYQADEVARSAAAADPDNREGRPLDDYLARLAAARPHYAFNVQRVDLTVN